MGCQHPFFYCPDHDILEFRLEPKLRNVDLHHVEQGVQKLVALVPGGKPYEKHDDLL